MSQPSLPAMPKAAEALWKQSPIHRDDAHEILTAIEPKIEPRKQAFSLFEDEIRECLALTLAFLIKAEIAPILDRMSRRLSEAINDATRASLGETILSKKPPKIDEALKQIFAVDDAKRDGAPQRRGRPKKELRDRITARLIDFLEFASGQGTHTTSDTRADAFLSAALPTIRDDFRTRDDPRLQAIAKVLDIPTTTRFIVQNANRRSGRISNAEKVYREVAKSVYLNNPIDRLKNIPVIFINPTL